jgi:hypothetical protein
VQLRRVIIRYLAMFIGVLPILIVQRPEIQLREDGLAPETFDLVEFRAFIVAEIARWKPMLRETGFAAQ